MIDLNLFGAPAFLIDVVPGGFRFNCVNRAREAASRLKSSDVEGRSPHQLFQADIADHLVRQFNECVMLGHAIDYEEMLGVQTNARTFLTTLSPITTEDGTRVTRLLGVAVDVTDRKRTEERTRQQAQRAEREASEAHARLRDALELLPEAIVFLDAEGRYVLWNRKYAELYSDVADLLAPGIRYTDILRASIDRGMMPEIVEDPESWFAERLEYLRHPGPAREERYKGGRWIRHEEQRTSEGGTIGVRVDITDLKAREQSFQLLFKENPLPMWLCDPNSLDFLDVNDTAVAAYGYTREQFLRMSILDIRPVEEREDLIAAVQSKTDLGKSKRIWRHRHADGVVVDVETYACELDYRGRPAVLVGVVDVTERRKAEARIAHLAHHDPLTELPNRALFLERLTEEFTRHRFQSERAAVLFLDLDHFKEVNDGLGHAEGDILLRQVARRLRNCLRGEDVVARLGGDEFAILIPKLDHQDHVSDLALRIVEVVSKPYRLSDHEVVIGVSVGIAFLPDDAESSAEVLRRADTALYRAKEAGRRTYRVYEPAMDARLQARRALVHDIGHALTFGQFHLEFQPIIDLSTNRISSCEALLRWRHPVRGLVSPAEFIPIAEDIGLIVQLGEWVLQQACLEAMKWPKDISVAINLSPVQFRKHNLVAAVTAAMVKSGLDPGRLELEITETVMLTDDVSNIESLNALRALGIRIAMDDFGTGYSSLSYLRSFPFDKIKIDRSFVGEMHANHHCQAIIRAVAELGRALNIVTTAEGVETLEQLTALRGFGYCEAQGYLFSPPRRDVIIRPLLNIWQKSNPKRSQALLPASTAR